MHMPKMIQIRHVPDALHRKLTARAAACGMTLSDYLKEELRRLAGRPTLTDIAVRLRAIEPVELSEPIVETLRQARQGR
jgi:plasmid stability protein